MHPKLRIPYKKPIEKKRLFNVSCGLCETTTTPLWRKILRDMIVCNACGIYWRTHGRSRPFTNHSRAENSSKLMELAQHSENARLMEMSFKCIFVGIKREQDLLYAYNSGA